MLDRVLEEYLCNSISHDLMLHFCVRGYFSVHFFIRRDFLKKRPLYLNLKEFSSLKIILAENTILDYCVSSLERKLTNIFLNYLSVVDYSKVVVMKLMMFFTSKKKQDD